MFDPNEDELSDCTHLHIKKKYKNDSLFLAFILLAIGIFFATQAFNVVILWPNFIYLSGAIFLLLALAIIPSISTARKAIIDLKERAYSAINLVSPIFTMVVSALIFLVSCLAATVNFFNLANTTFGLMLNAYVIPIGFILAMGFFTIDSWLFWYQTSDKKFFSLNTIKPILQTLLLISMGIGLTLGNSSLFGASLFIGITAAEISTIIWPVAILCVFALLIYLQLHKKATASGYNHNRHSASFYAPPPSSTAQPQFSILTIVNTSTSLLSTTPPPTTPNTVNNPANEEDDRPIFLIKSNTPPSNLTATVLQ